MTLTLTLTHPNHLFALRDPVGDVSRLRVLFHSLFVRHVKVIALSIIDQFRTTGK